MPRSAHIAAIAVVLSAGMASADPGHLAPDDEILPPPPTYKASAVDVEEHLGARVPLDARFRTVDGTVVTLGEVLRGELPTILTFNYSDCPMLCSLQLNGLVAALPGAAEAGPPPAGSPKRDDVAFRVGAQFRIVTISLEPNEPLDRLAKMRDRYLARLPEAQRAAAREGWTFLAAERPGDGAAIRRVAQTVGFNYVYVTERAEWAHPAALIFLSAAGAVTRYVYGIEFAPAMLRESIFKAGLAEPATAVGFMNRCYHYDPIGERSLAGRHDGAAPRRRGLHRALARRARDAPRRASRAGPGARSILSPSKPVRGGYGVMKPFARYAVTLATTAAVTTALAVGIFGSPLATAQPSPAEQPATAPPGPGSAPAPAAVDPAAAGSAAYSGLADAPAAAPAPAAPAAEPPRKKTIVPVDCKTAKVTLAVKPTPSGFDLQCVATTSDACSLGKSFALGTAVRFELGAEGIQPYPEDKTPDIQELHAPANQTTCIRFDATGKFRFRAQSKPVEATLVVKTWYELLADRPIDEDGNFWMPKSVNIEADRLDLMFYAVLGAVGVLLLRDRRRGRLPRHQVPPPPRPQGRSRRRRTTTRSRSRGP